MSRTPDDAFVSVASMTPDDALVPVNVVSTAMTLPGDSCVTVTVVARAPICDIGVASREAVSRVLGVKTGAMFGGRGSLPRSRPRVFLHILPQSIAGQHTRIHHLQSANSCRSRNLINVASWGGLYTYSNR